MSLFAEVHYVEGIVGTPGFILEGGLVDLFDIEIRRPSHRGPEQLVCFHSRLVFFTAARKDPGCQKSHRQACSDPFHELSARR